MSEQKDNRIKQLKSQLENAVVEHIGTEADDYPSWDIGTYKVHIPGAIRVDNLVKAKDEAEALKKVQACLEKKIEAMPDDLGEVTEIKPDNLKMKTSSKVIIEENNNG